MQAHGPLFESWRGYHVGGGFLACIAPLAGSLGVLG